jgi:hypothetical protein
VRAHAYDLFELVAWPAVAWGGIEAVLRFATGYNTGLADSLLIAAAGVATVTACRMRRTALALAPSRNHRQ